MMRSILLLILGGGAFVASDPPMKSQLQATITDLHGKPVAFRALSLGGDLTVPAGQRTRLDGGTFLPAENVEILRPQDTLRTTTPKSFFVDVSRGPIIFFTTGRDSIRVVLRHTRNEDTTGSVIGSGRRVTLRASKVVVRNGFVVVDTR